MNKGLTTEQRMEKILKALVALKKERRGTLRYVTVYDFYRNQYLEDGTVVPCWKTITRYLNNKETMMEIVERYEKGEPVESLEKDLCSRRTEWLRREGIVAPYWLP